jgi:hypothetical protein
VKLRRKENKKKLKVKMGNTVWDVIVAGMKFWSHEKTVPSTSANNTETFTNTTNTTQTVNNATYTTSQAYTFNNNTSVFQQILAHPFDDLARIIYLITALMTIFGALAGMIRTMLRYCKKDKLIKPTNEYENKITTYRAETHEKTNKPSTNIFPKLNENEEDKTKPNQATTNLRTETVTQVNNQITHATAPFYLKNTILENYKKENNISIWFEKLENFCNTYCLDKLRISKEYISEDNLEYIKSLAKQDKSNEIMNEYSKFKEAAIELFRKETNQNTKSKFYDRKQQENETPLFFYAELCKLAEDALPELHKEARNKQVKAQFLRNLTNQNIANILATKSMEDMNIVFKDIKTIEENINTISDNKDQYSNVMIFTRNNQNYNRNNSYHNSNNRNYNNQERPRREWRNDNRNDSPSRYNSNNCHNCGAYGHWKNNCPNPSISQQNQYQASNNNNQQNNDRNTNQQKQQPTQQHPQAKIVTNEQKKSLFNMNSNYNKLEELNKTETETKELLESIQREKQKEIQQQNEQEKNSEIRRRLTNDFSNFGTTANNTFE